MHEKYESSTSNGSKVMAKVKVLRNVSQGEGHKVIDLMVSFERVSLVDYTCQI